jgi:hypothetical protein
LPLFSGCHAFPFLFASLCLLSPMNGRIRGRPVTHHREDDVRQTPHQALERVVRLHPLSFYQVLVVLLRERLVSCGMEGQLVERVLQSTIAPFSLVR